MNRIETEARALVAMITTGTTPTGIPAAVTSYCAALVTAVAEEHIVPEDTAKFYRELATAVHGCDGECEIDDDADVSISEDGGAYVHAWVWAGDPHG